MDGSLPAETHGGMPRQWPVRLILVAIVCALVTPGLVFCAVLVGRLAATERARSEQAVSTAAQRAAESLDRELANMQTALLALGISGSLARNDLPAFHDKMRRVAGALGQPVLLCDLTGQQLANTLLPLGAAMPRIAALEVVRHVVADRRAAVSGLFNGSVSHQTQISVMSPVIENGEVKAVLATGVSPGHITALLHQQGLPPGWIAAVVDGNDRIVARTEAADRYVGSFASPDFVSHAVDDHDTWVGATVEGTQVLAASQRLRLANWRVGVGIAVATLEAPLRATLAGLLLTGAASLLVACAAAWQLGNSVTVPLRRLAGAGAALATGLPVLGVRSRIAEVDAVSRALVRATADLRLRANALAAERAQLAAVIETVPVGLVIADAPGGLLVSSNAQASAILRQPTRLGGIPRPADWRALHTDGRRVERDEFPLERVLRGASHAELQCLFRRGDGSDGWVELAAAPIRGPEGRITGAVVAVLDVDEVVRAREEKARWTESLEGKVAKRTAALKEANSRLRDEMDARSAAEEQLRQSQKMEAVGQLTGGIAHDFNNLLTVVIGSLDLLQRRVDDPQQRRLVDNAMTGASRAATLTARLLAFSRRQPLQPQPVDPNALVAHLADLLRGTLGDDVQVRTVLAPGTWQIHADPNQVENALLNLAVNGRDAMLAAGKAGGELLVETGNVALDRAALGTDRETEPGDYVRIAITDTGTGMPPDVAARVFEPFFTTKPLGQGTGLGLSQVHGFVKQSSGHVAIQTAAGMGTTVAIFLPRRPDVPEAQTAAPASAPAGTPGRPLTVLLVEDDEEVRRFSAEALEELGHTVIEAADAGVALDMLCALPPDVAAGTAAPGPDVMVTDVALPGMDGVALALAVRQRRPDLPILFASGYTGEDRRMAGRLPPGSLLLQKPFTVQGLAAKLEAAMEASKVRPAGLEPATKPL